MRRLRYALAASLAAHVLLLWPGSLRVLTKDTPALLQATLRTLPQSPPAPAPPKLPPDTVARPQSGLPGAQSAPAAPLARPVPNPDSPVLEQIKPSSVPQALAAPAAALRPRPPPFSPAA